MSFLDVFWPVLCAVGVVVAFNVGRLFTVYRYTRRRNNFRREMEVVAKKSYALVDAYLHAAECEADLAEHFTPACSGEFLSAITNSLGVAQTLQRYGRLELERRGLVPAEPLSAPQEASTAPDGPTPTLSAPRPLRAAQEAPTGRWVTGRFAPVRRLEVVRPKEKS